MAASERVLAWVGSVCRVPSPAANDDGAWNGCEIGDEEPCVLCTDETCVARVIDWQSSGDAIAENLRAREERMRAVVEAARETVASWRAMEAHRATSEPLPSDKAEELYVATLSRLRRSDAALRAAVDALDREEPSEPRPWTMSEGAALIAAERRRQVEAEGWSAEHDDGHDRGELRVAAAALAVAGTDASVEDPHVDNAADPWGLVSKHNDETRRLSIAGALIAAEIDRLIRREEPSRG